MKKIYSLLAAVVISATVNAQITVFNATFDDVDGTGGSDGNWGTSVASTALTSYTTGGSWGLTRAYKGGGCLKMGTSSVLGILKTPGIALSGNGTLTFRAAAWNGNNEATTLKISATGGSLNQATVTLVKASYTNYTINITNATGNVVIAFEGNASANGRFFIDDIKVTKPTMAVLDAGKIQKNLVKNTHVSGDIIFDVSAKVSVYNSVGQVIKTVEASENSRLDVSSLPKGIYIVSAEVDGKMVSQKIIKK
jgi:Secretion system C-terminal sorting domain